MLKNTTQQVWYGIRQERMLSLYQKLHLNQPQLLVHHLLLLLLDLLLPHHLLRQLQKTEAMERLSQEEMNSLKV